MFRKICTGIVLFLMSAFVGSYAQTLNQKQAEQTKTLAFDYYKIGDYPAAYRYCLAFIKTDTTSGEIYLNAAICRFKLKLSKDSTYLLLSHARRLNEPEAYYYLGQLLHVENKFDEEINSYLRYMNLPGKKEESVAEIERCIEIAQRAKEALKNPVASAIENMGDVINTPMSEYVPLLNAEENILMFTSRRHTATGEKLDEMGNYFEDIYVSKKAGGQWQKPENIGAPVNSSTHDACVSLSPDGQNLIVYRTSPDLVSGDLYSSTLDFATKTWSPLVKLSTAINSEYLEASASVAIDNQTMYFSSNRPGGLGGMDLYKANLLPNGEWGLPTNLGPTINTAYDEDGPFIHIDGKTLYFSSKGHSTIGGYDLFTSHIDDEGLWTEPENLGYPINSTDDDVFLVVSPDGKRGYYSSEKKDGFGLQDIYKINFAVSDKYLDILTGIVTEETNDKKPIHARITLLDEDNLRVSGIYASNNKSGRFIVLYNPNRSYKVIVEAEGYYPLIRPLSDIKLKSEKGERLALMLSLKK